MTAQSDSINYKGAKAQITFLDAKISGDSLEANTEYLIRIEIPGVPNKYVKPMVANGTIRKGDEFGEYYIKTTNSPYFAFSIGYSKEKEYRNHVSEKTYIIKNYTPDE
jgi:hypothetical protein